MLINQTQRRKRICTLRDWDVLTPYLRQNAHIQGDLCVIEQASIESPVFRWETYSPARAAELVLILLADLRADLLENDLYIYLHHTPLILFFLLSFQQYTVDAVLGLLLTVLDTSHAVR